MTRPGLAWSLAAALSASICLVALVVTASVARDLVTVLAAIGLILFLLSLAFGSSVAVGATSVLMLAAALIEAGASDEPVWIRSLLIACLWYVTCELGWEAIDRGDGSVRTRAAGARRLSEVGIVVIVSLTVGVVAMAFASFAPLRTLPIQVVVVAGFLAAFTLGARRITAQVQIDLAQASGEPETRQSWHV